MAAAQSAPPVNAKPKMAEDMFMLKGKVYRPKSNKEVNAGHCIQEMQQYVNKLPVDWVAEPFNPKQEEIPYSSIQDYVQTLRSNCSPLGPFTWPSEAFTFQRALTVALHHMPPGHMITIKNHRALPEELRQSSGGHSAEAGSAGSKEKSSKGQSAETGKWRAKGRPPWGLSG